MRLLLFLLPPCLVLCLCKWENSLHQAPTDCSTWERGMKRGEMKLFTSLSTAKHVEEIVTSDLQNSDPSHLLVPILALNAVCLKLSFVRVDWLPNFFHHTLPKYLTLHHLISFSFIFWMVTSSLSFCASINSKNEQNLQSAKKQIKFSHLSCVKLVICLA